MPIPTPRADNSGGLIVIKASNGPVSHRMRFHVLPFNADATGTYVTPPAGGEASVQATAAALMPYLAQLYNSGWTLTLDAVYQNVPPGPPIQYFGLTAPASVAGATGTAAGPTEAFKSYNFHTSGGGRMRVFVLSPAGWAYASASAEAVVSGAAGTGNLTYYLTKATTAIVGHDGTKPVAPARITWGTNRRIRRRVGNA